MKSVRHRQIPRDHFDVWDLKNKRNKINTNSDAENHLMVWWGGGGSGAEGDAGDREGQVLPASYKSSHRALTHRAGLELE